MKYMGSKAKVARYIVPIIQEQIERSGYETYLEPFCGGCNVIDKIEAPQRIASDCNKYLIALMQHIQAGGELPGYIEREEYAKVRANRDDYPEWYAGYVGFVASYNGRFFDGGYSGKTQTTGGLRDYQDEGRRNIEAQRDKLKDVIFLHKDYRHGTRPGASFTWIHPTRTQSSINRLKFSTTRTSGESHGSGVTTTLY